MIKILIFLSFFITTNIYSEVYVSCPVFLFPDEMKETKYLLCKGKKDKLIKSEIPEEIEFGLRITTLKLNQNSFKQEEENIKKLTNCKHSHQSVDMKLQLPILLPTELNEKDCMYNEDVYQCYRNEDLLSDSPDIFSFSLNRKTGKFSYIGQYKSTIYGFHDGYCELSSNRNKF
tara:strand:- start:250 stop:771 length:522 start_codon:yes stop_codon:yes gene_type:complete